MQNDNEFQEKAADLKENSSSPAVIKKTAKPRQVAQKKKTKKKDHLGIVFNAPVTLTFSLLCLSVMLIQEKMGILPVIFQSAGCQSSAFAFNWRNPADYASLLLHVFGHSDWNQLTGNLAFILLLGPSLEDRFGSGLLALMIAMTAFVTATINACFIPSVIMGTSGTVFMMILLSSFTTIDKAKIPLTFILLCIAFLSRLFLGATAEASSAAAVAHIAGGLCGGVIGYLATGSTR